MNRTLLALCAIFTVAGCAACDPKPDACKGVDCAHGTCSVANNQPICTCDDGWEGKCDVRNLCWGKDPGRGTCDHSTGLITCEANFYPDSSGSCSLHFDPSSLAQKVFCPADSGKLEITGIQGQFAALNGYWVEIQPNTFDRCVWVLLNPALGVNLPDPGRPGQLIPQAKGLEVTAVDRDNPVLGNGDPNEVQPLKEVKLLFKGHRGTVLLYKDGPRTFEDVPFSVVPEGSLGNAIHFSPFYLLNTVPAASAKATQKSGKTVEVDFTGTLDEGSPLSWGMTHEIWENGTLLDQRVSSQVWDIDLPGGNHTLTLKVKDPYGMEDSKTATFSVDLCTGNACLVWQTCREVDGACVGTDPCSPNPCMNGGTCSPTGVGTTACSCGNWSGSDCSICPSGFFVDSSGSCVDDPCLPNPCGNGGACSRPSDVAVCSCVGNWDPSASCNSCLPGFQDNDNDGTCAAACNSATCNSHGACLDTSGTATCACSQGFDPAQNCGACSSGYIEYPVCRDNPCEPDPCNGGTCSTASGACTACVGNRDPATNCAACLAGFGGANCDPVPTVSNLAIDCSSTGGCAAGGLTYPVTFSYTNATSCTAQAVKVSGPGQAGTLTPVSLDAGVGSLSYTSGGGSPTVTRITVTCQGDGGSVDSNPPLEFMQN